MGNFIETACLTARRRVALCFLAGLLSVAGFPPFNVQLGYFAGLSLFLIAFAGAGSRREGFLAAWVFGFGQFLLGLYWIGNALLVENNPYWWAWPLAVAGLPFLLSFFPAICLMPLLWFRNRGRTLAFAVLTACLLSWSEWLRGHLFTGFPWNLAGYIWSNHLAMVQSVSVLGVYGLSLLTLLVAVLPGYLVLSRGSVHLKIAVVLLGLAPLVGFALWGQNRLADNPTSYDQKILLRLVQPSIPQAEKWDPARTGVNFDKHLALSLPQGPLPDGDVTTLVIWPETAITYRHLDYLRGDQRRVLSSLLQAQGGKDAYLLTGILLKENDADGKIRYFNSLVTLDGDAAVRTRYDKSHLVPFGEYIPYQSHIPLKPIVQFEGFAAGPGPGAQTIGADISPFIGLICYEVIFPQQIDDRARWLLTVTNDGWYGVSPGPYQHFIKALYRGVELGVPMVRAASSGISSVTDPYGRVLARADINEISQLISYLPHSAKEASLFNSIGHKIYLALSFALLLGFCVLSSNRARK